METGRIRLFIAAGSVSVLLGLGVNTISARTLSTNPLSLLLGSTTHKSGGFINPAGLADFVALTKKIKPIVVNVSATLVSDEVEASPSPFGGSDPFSEFWQRFFGGQYSPGSQRQQSLGTGFIIDRHGYILTNYHVVENAEKIVVKLSDERRFEAKLVGKDPRTDIAVIRIDTLDELPAAVLGDSNRLEVGEWVMAVGNPFGLDNTVTRGIVSAKDRHIGTGPYDDFLQTDASINPGNSGGPLINVRGEVVGINTAIYGQTGDNMRIGFAIPINLVKELLPSLKQKGKVIRGYLGVVVQKVTPEIAESLHMDKPRGALVAEVSRGGPAEHGKAQVADVIIEFDGKEIKESNDLPILVARSHPGKQVRVKVLRDRKEMTLFVTMGEVKEEEVGGSREEQETLKSRRL